MIRQRQPRWRWFSRQDPLVKLFLVCLIAFLVLAILALVALPVVEGAPAGDDGYPPASITATVPVRGVVCKLGCCCGSVSLVYMGHWYDRPLGYCRWFRPLRNGDLVTTTLYLHTWR